MLGTTYHRAPSQYLGLEGLAALLFDRAVLWGGLELEEQDRKAAARRAGR